MDMTSSDSVLSNHRTDCFLNENEWYAPSEYLVLACLSGMTHLKENYAWSAGFFLS
jgi:hypothetical protein